MPPARKVLVVDDDELQLSVVSAWLTAAGYEVIQKNSPIGTTQVVLAHQPQVIVVDCDMPILAGPEMVDILIKRVKTVAFQVIFYSGKATVQMDGLVRQFPKVVLGALRKTNDGEHFVRQFQRLLRAG